MAIIGARRNGRKAALQMLFQMEASETTADDVDALIGIISTVVYRLHSDV